MECEDTTSTTFLDQLLTLAKAEILVGNGSVGFMASASANGKSFTLNEKLSCDDVAFACRTAKRLYTGAEGHSPITFLNFGA